MVTDAMRTQIGRIFAALMLLATLLLSACASMPDRDPLQVTVAGIEPLTGEGMEIRLLVKLRVQNPNDTPIEFNGVALNLDVMDRRFASGVSDESGTVPRFGEAIVTVPVTVSVLRMARQVMGMLDGKPVERINFSLSGKLHGAGMFGTQRFKAQGDFELPRSSPGAAGTT
jgi:LEA14-like dessication related protein